MTEHRRDSEEAQYRHRRATDLDDAPRLVRWVIYAVRTLGVSTVMCFLLMYFINSSLKEVTKSMERQSVSLEALIMTINNFHQDAKEHRDRVLTGIKEIQAKLR